MRLRLPTAALAFVLVALLAPSPRAAAATVGEARAAVQSERSKLSQLRAQQMARRAELNQLSARIAQMKEARGKALLASPELDAALKRSQELSAELTGLAQAVATAEQSAVAAEQSLHASLTEEIQRARASFDSTNDRAARQKLFAALKALRTERDRLRASLPASSLPPLKAEPASEEPEDLLEQADLLRDREDKLRRELKALEGRIAEAREERDLDRRMNEFLADEAMFDEQDRRIRLTRRQSGFAEAANSAANDRAEAAQPAPSGISVGASDSADPSSLSPSANAPMGSPSRAPEASPQSPPPPHAPPPPATPPSVALTVRPAQASDGRPVVGVPQRTPALESDDLEGLMQEQLRLRKLADELKARADSLEHKAKTLPAD